jgi:hypothetical protein
MAVYFLRRGISLKQSAIFFGGVEVLYHNQLLFSAAGYCFKTMGGSNFLKNRADFQFLAGLHRDKVIRARVRTG